MAAHPIVGVIVGLNGTFTVTGNVEDEYFASRVFQVIGSTGNDGLYTVQSATFVNPNTDIIINETIADGTIDGQTQALPPSAYTIDFSDPATPTFQINPGTSDISTSIELPGPGFSPYGEIMNENILHMLENFAYDVAPSNPVKGQLWFDTAVDTLKVWDGASFVIVNVGALGANFVEITGDTMTGSLTIDDTLLRVGTNVSGRIEVNGGATTSAHVSFENNGTPKARIGVPNSNPNGMMISGDDNFNINNSVYVAQNGNLGVQTYTPSGVIETANGLAGDINVGGTGVGSATLFITPSGGHTGEMLNVGNAVVVDNNGKIGVGTSIPENYLSGVPGGMVFAHDNNGPVYPLNQVKFKPDASTNDGFFVGTDADRHGQVWHEQGLSLRFGTSNTERMEIDEFGKVGIGGNPITGRQLAVRGTANTRVLIFSDDDTSSILDFGDNANSDVGSIQYDHPSDTMRFFTDTVERMRIEDDGNVSIGTASAQSNLHVNAPTNPTIRLTNSTTSHTSLNGSTIRQAGGDLEITNRENADVIFSTVVTEYLRLDGPGDKIVASKPMEFLDTVDFQGGIVGGSISGGLSVPLGSTIEFEYTAGNQRAYIEKVEPAPGVTELLIANASHGGAGNSSNKIKFGRYNLSGFDSSPGMELDGTGRLSISGRGLHISPGSGSVEPFISLIDPTTGIDTDQSDGSYLEFRVLDTIYTRWENDRHQFFKRIYAANGEELGAFIDIFKSNSTGSAASKTAIKGFATFGTGVSGGTSQFRGVEGFTTTATGVGVYGQSVDSGGKAVVGDAIHAGGFDFYAQGAGTNYGPFTGGHEGLMLKDEQPEIGDIVVDGNVINKANISNTIFENTLSTQPKQKSVIGVFTNKFKLLVDNLPSALLDRIEVDSEKGGPVEENRVPVAAVAALENTHDHITFNAVGEGQINVCKEGGDIEAGDFICSSSTPGKGMKQDDDLTHNYTVAKAREAVTWDENDDSIKQIACIYLCG